MKVQAGFKILSRSLSRAVSGQPGKGLNCTPTIILPSAQSDVGKNLKYNRQANRNRAIAKLREHFIYLLLEPNAAVRNRRINRMIDQIARYPVSIVPDRSPPRKLPRKKRFHMAKKAVVGLN